MVDGHRAPRGSGAAFGGQPRAARLPSAQNPPTPPRRGPLPASPSAPNLSLAPTPKTLESDDHADDTRSALRASRAPVVCWPRCTRRVWHARREACSRWPPNLARAARHRISATPRVVARARCSGWPTRDGRTQRRDKQPRLAPINDKRAHARSRAVGLAWVMRVNEAPRVCQHRDRRLEAPWYAACRSRFEMH
jgi:hypothetical protein